MYVPSTGLVTQQRIFELKTRCIIISQFNSYSLVSTTIWLFEHNVSQGRQRALSLPRVIRSENTKKLGQVVSEKCKQTDRQTTRPSQRLASPPVSSRRLLIRYWHFEVIATLHIRRFSLQMPIRVMFVKFAIGPIPA